ncbi:MULTISPECIES: hypothetical protein [unclassified Ruegeria]|uniref:hypothetical protein n=1 Tax=unclassified Ruegeria TaxID=2625375 RepID=UPI001489D49B|nr:MULTISPECIES: hypothetical protein [unclassified Ruegeria]NOD62184.1 hypothetical protein [Ruegeria sp. HKCCD6109]NOD96993.1 hypothetical protein [Ruegeria sp. HKCCD6228]
MSPEQIDAIGQQLHDAIEGAKKVADETGYPRLILHLEMIDEIIGPIQSALTDLVEGETH